MLSKHSENCVEDRNKQKFSACGGPRQQNLPETIDLDNGDQFFPSFLKSNKKTLTPLLTKSARNRGGSPTGGTLDKNLSDVNFVSRRPKMTKFSGALRAPTSKCAPYRFPFSKE